LKEQKKRLRAESKRPIIPTICRPGDEMSSPLYLIGWALRSLVLFWGVFGLMLFAGDGFGIYGKGCDGSVSALFIVSVALTVICSAAAWNSRLRIIMPIVGAGIGIGVLFTFTMNPFLLIWDGIRCVLNTAMLRVADLGYTSFADHLLGNDSYICSDVVLDVGCAVFATAIAIILSFSLLRKVHALPAVIVSVLFIAPVFIYNITKANAGVSMVLCFTFGEICLLFYEKKFSGYEAKKAAKKEAKAARKAAKKAAKRAVAEKRASLARAAQRAYAISLELNGDKSEARAAKRAVYSLDKKRKAAEKKAAKKAVKDAAAAKKAEKKAAKRAADAARKAEKKAAVAKKKRVKALPKEERARIAAEEKKTRVDARRARDEEIRERHRLRAIKETSARKTLSASGYAGGTAILLALLSVWLPFSVITGDFITIKFIDEPISVAREYITAYLKGDDIDLNNLGDVDELTPRTLSFESPIYQDIQIFSVESENDDPVYLRGWIGMDFDYETGTWTSADSDLVIAYRNKFGKSFTPNNLKTRFLGYLFPSVVDIDREETNPYLKFSRFGFAMRQIHLRRINGESLIIYTPPYVNAELGILGYGSMEKNSAKYSAYFDGIFSSRFFKHETKYSTVSYTTVLNDPDIANGLTSLAKYYDLFVDYADMVDNDARDYLKAMDGDGPFTYDPMREFVGEAVIYRNDLTDLNRLFEEECKALGISLPTGQESLLLRYMNMTDEEKESVLGYEKTEKKYREWALENYGGSIGSATVKEVAEDILRIAGFTRTDNKDASKTFLPVYKDKAGNVVDEHTVIMSVVSYLCDNYEYTLTPTVYEGTDKTVLDAFLTETKDGYCVHFATAAAALLREMGYSVRYAEGYIVTDFIKSYAENAPATYQQYALDSNAHSWVEVYHPYVGWVSYETVPIYNELAYTPPTSENPNPGRPDDPIVPTPPVDEPIEPDNPPEDEPDEPDVPPVGEDPLEEEETGDPMLILLIVAISVGSAVILFTVTRIVVKFIMKRAEAVVSDRHRHIVVGMDTELLRTGKIDTLPIAREYDDTIFRIFDLLGYAPVTGEQYSEYAARLEIDFGGMTDYSLGQIFDLVAKVEFGSGLTPEEMYVLADFTDRLTVSAYAGLSRFEKIRYRYLKRII